MNEETYTATGLLDLKNNQVTLTVALPNPPLRTGFNLTYFNLSKRSQTTGEIINAILCQFTFNGDPGNELASPTSDNFQITLALNAINKDPGLAGVMNFDFNANPECLFLFFHSTEANENDRQAFFDDMENLYSKAVGGSYVICPAPYEKRTPTPTGKPRAVGITVVR